MPKKQNLKDLLKLLYPGDLVCCEWYDASVGKSVSGGDLDIPVKSWGIFLGVLGQRVKHIVLAQNNFHYTNGIYDVDYTAIPFTWTLSIKVINQNEVAKDEAQCLIRSFLSGRSRTIKRRTNNHEPHD